MSENISYNLPLLIASDHAGMELKQELIKHSQNLLWNDLGCFNKEKTDYPDWAEKLCKKLKNNMKAILICGTGQGMAIKANRYSHVRAALCWDSKIAHLARSHNNANVLCLPGRFINVKQAISILTVFLTTPFDNKPSYERRVEKLNHPQ
ncbi:MAG: RpiB/LacA/LacB family sugar-phosphate isomerase [Bdellovibrionaceae bacterium]|nr:RpiB/LacA/LacB family sugar-phosphate isomerase [Pseudobdellovibrionaceae bacterium]